MSPASVVFLGSGPVAANSLSLLLRHTPVEAVITKPTTAREMALVAPDVPQYLVSTRQELDQLITSTPFDSQAGVLIDFGIIISQQVINTFKLGIVNSHFSLLPEWRGPDPITFSILSGQKTTGVSLMLLVEKMDEGPVIAYAKQSLKGTENTPELTQKLILLSDALLEHNLPSYLAETMKVGMSQEIMAEQTGKQVSYSRKLTKDDGLIDWQKSAVQLEREVRAFAEWPRSRTVLADKDVIITAAAVNDKRDKPGTVMVTNKQLSIACGVDSLEILRLKPAGKQEMTAQAFLAGYGSRL
jgi:methionyl-tRNA formyltransferase